MQLTAMLNVEGIQIFGVRINREFIDETTLKNQQPSLAVKAKRNILQNRHSLFTCSHTARDGEQLHFRVEDIVGKQVNVSNGMSGDNYSFIDSNGRSKGK